MPAPNLESLFAYELAIESAWKSILAGAGLNSQVEFSDGERSYPLVEVQLRAAKPNGHRHLYNGRLYFDCWEGTLVSRIITIRGKNSSSQAALLSKIRMCAMQPAQYFNATNLPYHAIDLLQESGLTRGVDGAQDISELSFAVVWNVRVDAWPTS